MSRRKAWSPRPQNSVVRFQDYARNEVEQKLFKISSTFASMEENCPTFLENIKKWTQLRRQTIASIKVAIEELDNIHTRSNAARCVGDGLAIIGAISELFGHFMDDSDKSRDVKNFGKNLSSIGCATSIGTSFIEEGLSSMKILNLHQMLQDDAALLKQIMPWFERSSNIDSALKEVFGIGILTSFEERGRIVIFEIFELFKKGKVVVSDVIDALTDMGYDIDRADFHTFTVITLPKLLDKLQNIFNDGRVIKIFEQILGKVKDLPLLLDVTQSCLRIISEITNLNLLPNIASCLSLFPNISTELDLVVPNFGNLAIVAFKSVFVAEKVACLISTTDKLLNDEPSKHAKTLSKLREQMIEEYNRIFVEFAKYMGRNRYISFDASLIS